MAQSQFSLSWVAHKSNICTGLSSLQQNGQFVDMTLAADGHHVKVHQVIMALVSPYIKELLASIQCTHPVIFLNNMSYTTLSAILEYVYTGEVLVPIDSLSDLMQAAKQLHIKGLDDTNLENILAKPIPPKSLKPRQKLINEKPQTEPVTKMEQTVNDETSIYEVTDKNGEKYLVYGDDSTVNIDAPAEGDIDNDTLNEQVFEIAIDNQDERMQTDTQDLSSQGLVIQDCTSDGYESYNTRIEVGSKLVPATSKQSTSSDYGSVQYTVSNQGSLQLILNRFMYYLKHTKRCGTRHWRCVDYLTPTRCPAIVITNEDVVLQRISAHSHTFHDKRILKKVKAGAIFTALHEAIQEGTNKKNKDGDTQEQPSE